MAGTQIAQLPPDPAGYAGSAPLLDDDARDMSVGDDRQIAAALRRPQIGLRGTYPPALARRQLIIAGALLTGPVEITRPRDAAIACRRDEGLDQLVLACDAADRDRTAAAMQLIVAELGVILELDEIRQDVVPTPSCVAEIVPSLVIAGLAADGDEAVDGARAAQHP